MKEDIHKKSPVWIKHIMSATKCKNHKSIKKHDNRIFILRSDCRVSKTRLLFVISYETRQKQLILFYLWRGGKLIYDDHLR